LPIYHAVPDSDGVNAAREALEGGSVDIITFSSSSTVRFFVGAVGVDAARRARIVSMGPITSETARALGLTVVAEAREATIDALVEALVETAGAPAPGAPR
jgi:uroporphyrinogen III methyltransferase/synthase